MAPPEYEQQTEVELLQELVDLNKQVLKGITAIANGLVVLAMQGTDTANALATVNLGLYGISVAENQISDTLAAFWAAWQEANQQPTSGPPVGGTISIIGGKMGLTVDDTTGQESVTFQFDDDDGNPTSAPHGDGSGIVVTLADASGNSTVGAAVVGADAVGNPTYTAPIDVTTTVPGSASFTATPANSSGAALTENDGVTPFPTIPALSYPITAGAPVAGSLSVAAS